MREIAGGAVHIGDNPGGQRPDYYTRGELPRGNEIQRRAVWVGNTMHGWRGSVVLTQCPDGLWLSYPQPTGSGDWASYLLGHRSCPAWVEEEYRKAA